MSDITQSIFLALIGGALIGLAASLMLIANGRIMGVSGIANGLLTFLKGDYGWRVAFILGLLVGGLLLSLLVPHFFANTTDRTDLQIAFAGVIVGFGTVLGSGCTSGHGICGIARLSPRSIIATLIFMVVGIVTATALKYFEVFL